MTFSYWFLACLDFLFRLLNASFLVLEARLLEQVLVFVPECENRRASGPLPWEAVRDGAEGGLLGPRGISWRRA